MKNKSLNIKKVISKNISKRNLLFYGILILIYVILRIILGPSSILISTLIIILILFRHSVEKIAAIMMSIGIIIYLLGADAEANRYFSFVYLLIILSLLRYSYQAVREGKKSGNK